MIDSENDVDVSVIITTFNRKDYLIQAVRSILDQSYMKFELIVVDDFSNYDVKYELSKFNDTRIKVYQNKSNGAVAVNRNFGISKSIGKYIAFCDDDDLWVENKLEIQVPLLKNHDLCFTNRLGIDSFGNLIQVKSFVIPKHISVSTLLRRNIITLSSVLVKKSVFVKFLPFDIRNEYIATEDYELWLRLLSNNVNLIGVDNNLVFYRVHSFNISVDKHKSVLKVMKINSNLREKLHIHRFQYYYYWLLNVAKFLIYKFI